MAARTAEAQLLTLGWKVTPRGNEPEYWVRSKSPRPGAQELEDLFRVAPATLKHHTAIIAQSGSGKSFFLGRLIEELLTCTLARCLIFDPNSDFRFLPRIEDESLWKSASYDRRTGVGKLPHEAAQKEFAQRWPSDQIVVRSCGGTSADVRSLGIDWTALSSDFLCAELGPGRRSEVYHCHEAVKGVHFLLECSDRVDVRVLLARAEDLLDTQGELTVEAVRSKFDVPSLSSRRRAVDIAQRLRGSASAWVAALATRKLSGPREGMTHRVDASIDEAAKSIAAARKRVSADVIRSYFASAIEYSLLGMIELASGDADRSYARAEVVDLASIPARAAMRLTVNSVLSEEWDRARAAWRSALAKDKARDDRVPTFVVVDEAHNLMPKDTRGEEEVALRDQFRTIVAEGRKYGLFLIAVTQRPDKIDPMVLSGCENLGVMKVDSASVLEMLEASFGLSSVRETHLDQCLTLERSRVVLAGPWCGGSAAVCYSAARRTREGGRDLRDGAWCVDLPGTRGGARKTSRAASGRQKPKQKRSRKGSL